MIKFKNWLIKLAIAGLVKAHKEEKICSVINALVASLQEKYLK